MKKMFRQIHLWLSVPFGIVLTLICFSGAMLVFEREIVDFAKAEYFRAVPAGEALPADSVASLVAATLPADVRVSGVTISSDPERAYQVSLSKPRHASVYVDQYSGEVKGLYERSAFFAAMFSLHRWLLGSRPDDGGIFWGKMIVGISTLLFVAVLLSGVVLWWPRTKAALRSSLKIIARKGLFRFWHGLHVAGGMYALLLLMVMALTGLTWSFDWYCAGFYKIFGAEVPQRSQRSAGAGASRGRSDATFANWQRVCDELKRRNPDFKQITVSRGSATVSFDRLGNTRASDRYTFDARTGEITGMDIYENRQKSQKLRGWIYSLHMGSFGGMATRVLWFLAAMLGASLPLTGYYLWIRRLWRKGGIGFHND